MESQKPDHGSGSTGPKPLQTRMRWGRLASVFSPQDEALHTLIARICVLFEDLRIETAGMGAKDIGRLDDCGKSPRQLYFLRRSMATLFEFEAALDELDQLPSFQPIRARFNKVAAVHWPRALAYFRKHRRYIARMRHNVGGHFGKEAAEMAVAHIQPHPIGALEIAFYNPGGGAKLFFTHEIVATAVLGNVRGTNVQAKARKMIRHALVAYRHAVFAVDCVTNTYLWDRFGN